MDPQNTVTIGLEPAPYPVPDPRPLAERDARLVYQWAALNRLALVEYWHGRIGTAELLARLETLTDQNWRRPRESGRPASR
jgi:hypothetical protein